MEQSSEIRHRHGQSKKERKACTDREVENKQQKKKGWRECVYLKTLEGATRVRGEGKKREIKKRDRERWRRREKMRTGTWRNVLHSFTCQVQVCGVDISGCPVKFSSTTNHTDLVFITSTSSDASICSDASILWVLWVFIFRILSLQ